MPLRLMGQMRRIVLLAVALSLSLGIETRAELPVKKVITLEVAKKIAAAAEAEAKKRGATVVIVVVDDGGHLLLLERLDDTQVPVWKLESGRHARQRFSDDRAKCLKIRSAKGL